MADPLELGKDCTMYFNSGNPPYKFCSKDLATALKYVADKNLPVVGIATPWCYLSVFDTSMTENVLTFLS